QDSSPATCTTPVMVVGTTEDLAASRRPGREAPGAACSGSDEGDDRAVNDEARGAERAATGPRDAAVVGQSRDGADIGLADVGGGGDVGRAPLREVHVPEGAVAAPRRSPRPPHPRV